jgi:AraC-like DNA-binding protein
MDTSSDGAFPHRGTGKAILIDLLLTLLPLPKKKEDRTMASNHSAAGAIDLTAESEDKRGPTHDLGHQTAQKIVARLLSLVARHGGNPEAILFANGFDQPLDCFIAKTLSSLDIVRLQKLSAQASVAASDLQARAAGRATFHGGDWRLLFYCLVGSRTLREAIMRMEELLAAIDGRMGWITLKRSGTRACLTYSGARSGDEEMDFIVALHGQLMFHSIFSWLIGKALGGALALDFSEAARIYLDEGTLPFDLSLGAERPELSFPGYLLDRPVIRTMEGCEALPSLNFLFGLQTGQDPVEIVRRSHRFLAVALRDRRKMPSFDELAQHLAVGRMQAAGTSFRMIRDDLRQEIAIDLLSRSQLSIEEIAERLDLCDSNALRRAFRGWTGMAPTEFRRSLLQPSPDR